MLRIIPLLFVLALASCVTPSGPAPGTVRIEAETAQLFGVDVAADRVGYSGTGFLTGFDESDDTATLRFTVDPGIYMLSLGYSAPLGEKGFEVEVNGSTSKGMLLQAEGFDRHVVGKFTLNRENTIVFHKGWGWYDIDYIDLTPTEIMIPRAPPAGLVDSLATPATKRVHAYLCEQFGRKTLTGQFGFKDIEYIQKTTGKTPALIGLDYMDYSVSRQERHKKKLDLTQQIVKWMKSKGGILTLSWHWNAPTDLIDELDKEWWRGFYTKATTFDVAAALADPSSRNYKLLIRDIDVIAKELLVLADADIPVLWRPLHEANGRWFWWGAGGPVAFRRLWLLLFDRLTNHHQLHNLIWVYSPSKEGCRTDDEWYPGDRFVDIVAPDIYADITDNLSARWDPIYKAYGGRKLIALGECGVPPNPGLMRAFEVRWSSFALWPGHSQKVPAEVLKAAFNHADYITLDELPQCFRGHTKE